MLGYHTLSNHNHSCLYYYEVYIIAFFFYKGKNRPVSCVPCPSRPADRDVAAKTPTKLAAVPIAQWQKCLKDRARKPFGLPMNSRRSCFLSSRTSVVPLRRSPTP